MKTFLSLLSFAALTSAHGYLKSITLDNVTYPGFDPHQDPELHAKRIIYSWDQGPAAGTGPVTNVESNDIACNLNAKPPALVGKARAGSQIIFNWTRWVINHKGPMITYMAPYTDSPEKQDINKLKFFKIDETAVVNEKWATDILLAGNNKWNVTIPWDIKPGKYVVRHELVALHFARGGINGYGEAGAQIYLACAAVEVEGKGTAQPEGVTFPGAYKKTDPGLTYRLYHMDELDHPSHKEHYTIPGPQKYVPKGTPPTLAPNPAKTISPMGDPVADTKYYENLKAEEKKFGEITDSINAMPMGKSGYTYTPEMEQEIWEKAEAEAELTAQKKDSRKFSITFRG